MVPEHIYGLKTPGANPTIASYNANAIAVKIHSATNSMAHFYNIYYFALMYVKTL
jgi:hypothetical protein